MKPVKIIHIHKEYKEHLWEKTRNGEIDVFAFEVGYHNGPVCKRCGYSFCIHCNPDGFNAEPCVVDEYRCPKCKSFVSTKDHYCRNCGQRLEE